MNLRENIAVALQGLAANKLRSALTMLGIIIGVLAVILGTAIGQGSRDQVLARIQSLGSNAITVSPNRGPQRGAVGGGAGSGQSLTMEDAEAIKTGAPTVTAVAPQFQRSSQVKYLNQNTSTSIVCTTPEFLKIRGFSIERGQMFTDRDVRGRRKVCIVGKTTATTLFGDGAPIGRNLRIGGINFKITGLLASKGNALFGDPDDQIVIPITTGMNQVFGVDRLNQIYAQTARAEDATRAAAEIEEVLRKAHKLTNSEESDFQVRTQQEFMELQDASSQTLTFLLTGIAAVALVVGGIGIMNIMLVSVTERTREIGIRKAVGARGANILLQFLIEATTLSVLGGIIGIGAGFAVCALVTQFLGFPTVISWFWIAVSFTSSAVIGVFFGIYPAYTASQLDPIEALRYQ